MKKEDALKLPKNARNPIFNGMPDYLKDQANYEKIQKAILDAGATKHSHGEMVDWAGCKQCQDKQANRVMFMRKIGFKNAAQYMAWQKVMEHIKERVPLPKYDS